MQFFNAAATPPGEGGVAFRAHVGASSPALCWARSSRSASGLMRPPLSSPFATEGKHGPWG